MSARILLVEDEPGLVMTLSDLLGAEGYEVESATDGLTGLAKALKEKFDLIVLDVMLPGKSGLEVCRELRQQGNDVAVLMLTAKTQLYDRVVGLKLGADDYLTKPFEPPELLARIEALLRRVKHEKLTAGRALPVRQRRDRFRTRRGPQGRSGAKSRGQGTRTTPLPDRSPRQRGLHATNSWKPCGSINPESPPAPSTCTSPGCAKSSKTIRKTPATYTPSEESATASPRRTVHPGLYGVPGPLIPLLPQHLPQFPRILHGEPAIIIIEKHPSRLHAPSPNPVSPHTQCRGVIKPLVLPPRPMQPHIRKVRSNFKRRFEPGQMINTKRRPMPPQQLINALRVPRIVPELEGIPVRRRQRLQKRREPLDIHPPMRRKLKHHRPELLAQKIRRAKNRSSAGTGSFNFFI